MDRIDFMIDIETISLANFPVLAQIGCTRFDLVSGEIYEKFKIYVDPMSCIDFGADFSLDTFKWWMGQAAFKNVIIKAFSEGVGYEEAIKSLHDFMIQGRATNPDAVVGVWVNGIAGDIVWVESYFKKMAIEPLWGYREPRDVRTILDLAKTVSDVDPKKEVQFEGDEHDALADSIYQSKYVACAYRILTSKK